MKRHVCQTTEYSTKRDMDGHYLPCILQTQWQHESTIQIQSTVSNVRAMLMGLHTFISVLQRDILMFNC